MEILEAERIRKETLSMIQYLKEQEKEQHELQIQNEILAREALMHGFDPDSAEPPIQKKGRKAVPKSKSEASDQ